jgi:hypothetical protein
MKTTIKHTVLLAGLIIGSLATSPIVFADNQTTASKNKPATASKTANKEQDKANKKAIKEKEKEQNKLLEMAHKGINEGLKKVTEATKLINKGKEKEAIKALEAATGKFDIALAADPELGLIPVNTEVIVTDLKISTSDIKLQLTLAKKLLRESKIQAARAVLLPLRDDIETKTIYLPMKSYPDAIKEATKSLIAGDKAAAEATLALALTTLVEKVSIIPLSLIRTEAMMIAAAKLDKEKDKNKALLLLDTAAEELQLATLLGYTGKDSSLYEDLSRKINELKTETKGGNIVERLYKKLNNSIKVLLQKSSEATEGKKEESAEPTTKK